MGNALYRSGEIVRKNIVKGIRDQKYKSLWPALKENTLKAKTNSKRANKGKGSSLILIDKGDYLSSFAVAKKSTEEVHVGSNHPQSRALEFGYEKNNIPARPHVLPAFEDSKSELETELTSAIGDVFR